MFVNFANGTAAKVDFGKDEIGLVVLGLHVRVEQTLDGLEVRYGVHTRVIAVEEIALDLLVERAQTAVEKARTVGARFFLRVLVHDDRLKLAEAFDGGRGRRRAVGFLAVESFFFI